MAETEVIEQINEITKLQVPKMYKVLLHNDDTTTFDFVIAVLMHIFHKTVEDAIKITKEIHVNGQGIAGAPYTHEVAKEKTTETINFARANKFQLTPTFEEL